MRTPAAHLGATVAVKVVAGAREDRVVGRLGGAIKVHVSAAPERGKANAAVEALLAQFFGVRRQQVTVVQGHAQPRKVVRVEGLTPDDVRRKLLELGA